MQQLFGQKSTKSVVPSAWKTKTNHFNFDASAGSHGKFAPHAPTPFPTTKRKVFKWAANKAKNAMRLPTYFPTPHRSSLKPTVRPSSFPTKAETSRPTSRPSSQPSEKPTHAKAKAEKISQPEQTAAQFNSPSSADLHSDPPSASQYSIPSNSDSDSGTDGYATIEVGEDGFSIFAFVAYGATAVVAVLAVVAGVRHFLSGRNAASRDRQETRVHIAGLDDEASGRMMV